MKIKGFTLTEVLITLGIIGVIAALTIPQLYSRTRNAHLGAQLANAISTIENATGLYIYDQNVRNLSQLNAVPSPKTLLQTLADNKYIKLSTVNTSDLPSGLPDTCTTAFSLPDKSIIGACSDTAVSAFNNAAGQQIFFLSSTSANQDTAIEGLDFFIMTLAADGLIYLPGRDYDADAACTELDGGAGCAGKIASNGWKVDKKIYKTTTSTDKGSGDTKK